MPRGRPKKVVVVEDAFKEVVETVEKVEETPVEKTVEVKKPRRGRPKKETPNIEELVKKYTIPEPLKERECDNKKVLLVIDMQNDFITGSLANKNAEKIIDPMCQFIKDYDGYVIFTQDTHHDDDYLDSSEGKKLPIKHCIRDTDGWNIHPKLIETTEGTGRFIHTAWKFYFSAGESLRQQIENVLGRVPNTVDIVGVCTDICVVSNALTIKTAYQDSDVNVWGNLCAGTTVKKHNAALDTMDSCHINILTYEKPVHK